MDGQVSLESFPGHGSKFSIALTLPISDRPGETVKSAYPEAKPREVQPLFEDSSHSPIVLAVDDHPINRDLLARQIRLLGARTETAETGKIALEMWQRGGFAMIITDCHMPEMDGYALVKAIRKIEASTSLPRTPVVAWTANALAEESNRCEESGMDDLLVKPAEMKQLRNVLAKWLAPDPSSRLADLFDLNILNMIAGDKASQMEVLNDFLRHIKSDHVKLHGYSKTGSLEDIENIAHKMKEASRMIGERGIADACETIESAAKTGNMVKIGSGMQNLEGAVSLLSSFVSSRANL